MNKRHNLVSNPKAKTNTAGWVCATYAGELHQEEVSRVTDWSAEGVPTPVLPDGSSVPTGFKISPATTRFFYYSVEVPASGDYTFSALAYIRHYADDFECILKTAGDDFIADAYSYPDAETQLLSWQRFMVAVRVDYPLLATFKMGLYVAGYATTQPRYLTAARIQRNPKLDSEYFDGDSFGWHWNEDGTSEEDKLSVPVVKGVSRQSVKKVLDKINWRS